MNTERDIVVGVDGSYTSTAAVAWAAAEARRRRCGIHVVYVYDARGFWSATPLLRSGLRELCKPVVTTALEVVTQIDPTIPAHGDVLIGSISRTLLRLSQKTDLMVVGRRGRDSIAEHLFGSVPLRLMANAACPVVAVGAHNATTCATDVHRVVAAWKGPSEPDDSLGFAVATARRHGVPLHVVHVKGPTGDSNQTVNLENMLLRLREANPDVKIDGSVEVGSIVELVAAACDSADLLVLAHERPPRLGHHALGSLSTSLLTAAPCPVAVVHEIAPRPSSQTSIASEGLAE